MDFTKPAPAETQQKKQSHKLRKVLLWCAGVLLFLLLVILFIPTILSTQFARSRVVSMINDKVSPASITIEDWSLAWFHQQSITGITYKDARQGVDASVKQLSLNSLFGLLPVGHISADILVDSPNVNLFEPVAPVSTSQTAATSEEPSSTKPQAAAERKSLKLPAWDLSLHLQVQNANVRHYKISDPLISNTNFDLLIPNLSQEGTFSLKGAVLDAALDVAGQLRAPLSVLDTPESILSTLSITAKAPWIDLQTKLEMPKAYPEADLQTALKLQLPLLEKKINSLQPTKLPISFTKGELSFSASIQTAAHKGASLPDLTLKASLDTSDVNATFDGKPLAFSPKCKIDAKLPLADISQSTINKLTIDLPGLQAIGNGTMQGGSLDASLNLQDLLSLAAPFTGDIPLAKPVQAYLHASTKDAKSDLIIKASSDKESLLEVQLNATGKDLLHPTQVALKSSAKLEPLAPFIFKESPFSQFKGSVYFNATATGTEKDLKAKLVLAVQDLHLVNDVLDIHESNFLKLTSDVNYVAPNQIQVSNLLITSPIAEINGNFKAPFDGKVQAVLHPARMLALLSAEKQAQAPKVTGNVNLNLAHEGALDAKAPFSLDLASEDLQVAIATNRPFATPFTIHTDVLTNDPTLYTLQTFDLTSPYVESKASGTYTPATQMIEIAGELTPDFAQLWTMPFCDPYRENFAITGKNTHPFSFKAPLTDGSKSIFNYGTGSAKVSLDTITVPGLDIPNATLSVTLNEGIIKGAGIVKINGGEVNLNPEINVSNLPFVLTIPDNTAVVKDIALTTKLLDTALKFVNPLLPGSAKPTGTVGLIVESFRMELSDQPLATLTTEAKLNTKSCSLQPNGLLGLLLDVVKARNKVVYMDDQSVGIHVSEGKLTCDGLRMNAGPIKLTCSGYTNLADGTVDYRVKVPLSENLLGSKLSKRISLREVSLPLTGNIKKAHLDVEPLSKLFLSTVTSAVIDSLSTSNNKKKSNIGQGLGTLVNILSDEKPANEDSSSDDTVSEGSEEEDDSDEEALAEALNNLFKRKKK